ncbi:putative nuclear pore complex protein [Apostichopus japonicus]|uniref:Nuclear pore protein n=1 Tax=Stichopus japonicus TaxID=307972 RepID=A0A2G8JJA3_STIJA|nr:putative nuclear pore complex protein [Apostichopus japonicus]
MEGFGDLLRSAEQLTADVDTGTELPRIEQNLHQIMETSQRLWTKTAQIGGQDETDVKALILLGSKGLDVPHISHRLESLSTAKTFEPLEPVGDTDIQGFLRNERENNLLAVIEETKQNSFQQAEQRFWDSLQSEWDQEKQRILDTLIGSSPDLIDVTADSSSSMISDRVHMEGRSNLDNVEMAYARQVYIYNDRVVSRGVRPNLVDLFKEASVQFENKNVTELWTMVGEMSSVPACEGSDVADTRSTSRVQASLIAQARGFLESCYVEYIRNIVSSNMRQAMLGGIPGTYPLVQAFLKIKLPVQLPGLEDGEVDNLPIWPIIYYCLRCGDLDAIATAVRSASQDLGEFEEFLQEYMENEDRRLSPGIETKLRLHYRRAVRNSSDPFKRAVYCIMGKCDISDNHVEICDKTEDYLWLKLCQVSFQDKTPSSSPSDHLSLQTLQITLCEEYGESHFSAHLNPFLYFKVLFLSAQFEAAIEFLSRTDSNLRSHAVHAAIALHELGLLILPENTQTPILSRNPEDPSPMQRLNYTRLIIMYTAKFEATDSREALQYYFLLRNIHDTHGKSYFVKCLSELVVETREFETLLGRREADGSRRQGAIDKFGVDTQNVIETVADDTENKGLFEEAVKLYDLGGNVSKVLEIMNRLLSPLVSMAMTPQSKRDRLRRQAVALAERYQMQAVTGSRANTRSFYLLLDLMTFFDQYHAQEHDQALETINRLQVIALTRDTVDDRVTSFKQYTDEIRRNLPDILLATMNILCSKYRSIRSNTTQSPRGRLGSRPEDGGKERHQSSLRMQAKSLITFAGMLPYRLPGDTNARLVQLEVLMN